MKPNLFSIHDVTRCLEIVIFRTIAPQYCTTRSFEMNGHLICRRICLQSTVNTQGNLRNIDLGFLNEFEL